MHFPPFGLFASAFGDGGGATAPGVAAVGGIDTGSATLGKGGHSVVEQLFLLFAEAAVAVVAFAARELVAAASAAAFWLRGSQ